ncbi:hypothetical protein HYU15_01280 [Candidatus Woesearchaeota archaeon]|nr:hypothetical protein [Candidatus Woesearchaeota archaeon]
MRNDCRRLLEDVVETEDGETRVLFLDHVRGLGSGGGAVVNLYDTFIRTDGSIIVEVAEKAFRHTGLTGAVAWLANFVALQTASPYGHSYHAIRTAYHRRKVMGILTNYWFGEEMVADALYTRFDSGSGCFVLGTEFIEGSGYTYKDKDIVPFLRELGRHMQEAGLYGPVWSIDDALGVSTSNIIKRNDGTPIVTDLESSIPAVPLPFPPFLKYALWGLRNGAFPMHDDTCNQVFSGYVAGLEGVLENEEWKRLNHHAEKLQQHERLWKLGEIAFLRNGARLLHGSSRAEWFAQLNARYADYWLRSGLLSEDEAAGLREGSLKHGFLEWKAKDLLFFSAIRRQHMLGFISGEEAAGLRKAAYDIHIQLKDAVGIVAQAGISFATPGITTGSVLAFAATGEFLALTPLLVSLAVRNTYNLAALAALEVFGRNGQNRNWPWIIGAGMLPLPFAASAGYAASLYADNRKVSGVSGLFRISTRDRLAGLLRAIPYFGSYNSRFAQAALRCYDAVFYRGRG